MSDTKQHEYRMAHRASIRAKIAERANLLDRHSALGDELARLEQLATEAADEHSATTEPLQQELKALEAAAIDRVRNREPPSPEDDTRRVELSRQIEAANSELRDVVDRVTRLKVPVERERHDLMQRIASMPTPDFLLHPTVANPQMLSRKFGLSEFVTAISNMAQSATKSRAIAESNDRISPGDIKRVAKWDGLISVLSDYRARVQAELDEHLQAMRDE